jgi:hypothetical protein
MNRPYLQFPLSALRIGRDVQERLNCIISFAAVEMGRKKWRKFTPTERQGRRSVPPPPQSCKCKIDLTKDDALQVVVGGEYLGIRFGCIKQALIEHACVMNFTKDFEQRHGTDARVRICKDWIFEVRDNKGMSYAEFAVLVAIYSKIGANKRPVRITREEIWRRALGCKSQSVFKTETDGQVFGFTRRKVRSIIERLHDRKFFARVTFARRETYYSHRLSGAALAEHVFASKVQRCLTSRARRRADAGLTKRIQAERRKLAGSNATQGATEMPP